MDIPKVAWDRLVKTHFIVDLKIRLNRASSTLLNQVGQWGYSWNVLTAGRHGRVPACSLQWGGSALCGLDLGGGRPVPVAAASPAVGKTE